MSELLVRGGPMKGSVNGQRRQQSAKQNNTSVVFATFNDSLFPLCTMEPDGKRMKLAEQMSVIFSL